MIALKSSAEVEKMRRANAIVAAVSHRAFRARSVDAIVAKLVPGGIYADVKCQADAAALRERGVRVWRL